MWLFLKNLVFTLVVPGVVVGWVPYVYLLRRPVPPALWSWTHWLALLPLVVGIAGYLACVWQFMTTGRGTPAPIDPPKKLVQRGLYRWVRNPMYLAVLLVVLGEVIFFRHFALVLYFFFLASAFQLFVVLYEEPVLRRRFGAIYSDYCNAVNRWVPGKPKPRLETVAPFNVPR
ncbi:MAG TPA: isoprenylcysteine carboxylmethyltransferase family protein [Lacunisphaera sp.]|nr:isoprenylcysteine carboxylmethyltransferase family protein [Lacunisphaera sp.]